ncbi:hypothetical protein EVB62_056 [Rhizobium phage RHph_TM33]|uniref:Uncharacterized protein n=1 Tax=Rhizobium phage RHph_TM33 TaxID=2509765 RepID=A0A7S5QYR0_9CAUD|nr:hypothetical protein EVB62_056 [Rhizobium phage RHph_TM33]QIG68514.1 hypothetical protein EVB63_055 [Rhizobium phage RHph_TM38]
MSNQETAYKALSEAHSALDTATMQFNPILDGDAIRKISDMMRDIRILMRTLKK